MLDLERLPNSVPSEKVEIFLRRHWIDLIKIFAMSGAMLLVPLAIGLVFTFGGINLMSHPIWSPIIGLLLSSYLLIVFMVTITEITDYWLDVWIVTTERVLNTEQLGLFNRVVSELHLEQIQDITSETKGFLATFLTYGDVHIQTAAEKERFRFKNIDNPDDVKIKVSELVSVCKRTHHHDPRNIAPGIGAPATTRTYNEKIFS